MNVFLQQKLSPDKNAEFYHDMFVRYQACTFIELLGNDAAGCAVIDNGGGEGFFAERLHAIMR